MAFVNSWVETDPDGAVIFVSQLDDAVRTTKGALRERLEGDPAAPDLTGLIEVGSFQSAPKPRKGTARVYVDTQANILAFGASKREDGRLAIASDSKRLYHVATAAVAEIAYVPLVGGVNIVHNGVGNPVLGILTQDGVPWALAIQNDNYSTDLLKGLKILVSNGGDVTIAAPDDGSSPGHLTFQTDGFDRWRITDTGDLVNLSLSKNFVPGGGLLGQVATNGFFYCPVIAGAPLNPPTDFSGGKAMVYDSVNNRLYVYNGSWRFVAF